MGVQASGLLSASFRSHSTKESSSVAMRVSHRKIRKLPSLRRRHRPIDRAVGLERALVDATGGGRFDGADLDALGLDAGDAPERELALRWLCARANTITCRLIT